MPELPDSEETLQALWGGYGKLSRRRRDGVTEIVKDVRWPTGRSDRSHLRKVRSYEVEARWYDAWAKRVPAACRIPACRSIDARPGGLVLVLEDLDAAGFSRRASVPDRRDLVGAIGWLARFHAAFLGVPPTGLWDEGGYWHLDTRPDELEAMPRGPLRDAARDLDERLARARFRTLVHGDAKPDNFCLRGPGEVAMVDFQYVGGGCGMRDLAYLLDGVFDADLGDAQTAAALDEYFAAFRRALAGDPVHGPRLDVIEAEWRGLFPVAWLDFQRFLQGWLPAGGRPCARLEDRIRRELGRLA